MKKKITSLIVLIILAISAEGCQQNQSKKEPGKAIVETQSQKIEFDTKTIDKKEISSDVFKDYKLTMVNIWATYCDPCIEEMPELEKLYQEMKEKNVNIMGVISDLPDFSDENVAIEILKTQGVTFSNIIPDESLQTGFLNTIEAVPTTVFVDSEGNIVGDPIMGSNSKEVYEKEIEKILKTLK